MKFNCECTPGYNNDNWLKFKSIDNKKSYTIRESDIKSVIQAYIKYRGVDL